MGLINVTIYGREYELACDDGQEARLSQLSQMINDRVKVLSKQMGRGSEHTMLVYTALMLADELMDAQIQARQSPDDVKQLMEEREEQKQKIQNMELAMASSMQQIASQIHKLTDQLEEAA